MLLILAVSLAIAMTTPASFSRNEETVEENEHDAGRLAEERLFETQMNAHLWGYLKPCNAIYAQLDFWKLKSVYKIGRLDDGTNDICIIGPKISTHHCTIQWDGKEDTTSQVVVYDYSSNGTFVNGCKIGKGRCAMLRDSDVLSFASPAIIKDNEGSMDDYRFQFHHMIVRAARLAISSLYTKHDDVGHGSFGTVWRAWDHKRNMMVAIKTLRTDKKAGLKNELSLSKSQRCRSICREISIMEQLNHPNVCELLEFFYDPSSGEIHLILEYAGGGDLFNYILARDSIDEELGRHIAFEICTGVAYLHAKGITHRDIKPENILLSAEMPPRVKITDFGLSKLTTEESFLRSYVGTLNYMAPELFGKRGYDQMVDSWAIGVVVHTMFTKEYPRKRTEKDKPSRFPFVFDEKLSRVSAECRRFILRLMEPAPTMRLSVTGALQHCWLFYWVPIYDHSEWYAAHPQGAFTRRSESWTQALEVLEQDAIRAEQDELGLETLIEEEENLQEESQETVVEQQVTRRVTSIENRPEKVLKIAVRRSERVAVKKKGLVRQGTPYPPQYLS